MTEPAARILFDDGHLRVVLQPAEAGLGAGRAVALDPQAESHALALATLLRDTGAAEEALLACQGLLARHSDSEAARRLLASLAAAPPTRPEPPPPTTAAQGGGFLSRLLGRG